MRTLFKYRPVMIDTPKYQHNIWGFLVLGLCCILATQTFIFALPRGPIKWHKFSPWTRVTYGLGENNLCFFFKQKVGLLVWRWLTEPELLSACCSAPPVVWHGNWKQLHLSLQQETIITYYEPKANVDTNRCFQQVAFRPFSEISCLRISRSMESSSTLSFSVSTSTCSDSARSSAISLSSVAISMASAVSDISSM